MKIHLTFNTCKKSIRIYRYITVYLLMAVYTSFLWNNTLSMILILWKGFEWTKELMKNFDAYMYRSLREICMILSLKPDVNACLLHSSQLYRFVSLYIIFWWITIAFELCISIHQIQLCWQMNVDCWRFQVEGFIFNEFNLHYT